MKIAYAFFALLLCSHTAFAAKWVPYFKFGDGDQAYLDAGSVFIHGTKRAAWTKVEKAVPAVYGDGLLNSWMARVEVDCKTRMQRILSEVGHQPDGSMLYQFPEQNVASAVVPESMGEARLEAMCKLSQRKRPK
jgi:hypothetical protein